MLGNSQFPSITSSGFPRMPPMPQMQMPSLGMNSDMDAMMQRMMGQMSMGSDNFMNQHISQLNSFANDDFFNSTNSNSVRTGSNSKFGQQQNMGLNLSGDAGFARPNLEIDELSTAG